MRDLSEQVDQLHSQLLDLEEEYGRIYEQLQDLVISNRDFTQALKVLEYALNVFLQSICLNLEEK